MSSTVPALTPRKLIAILKRAGFYTDHIRGSHHYLKHPDKPGLILTVPYHSRDLKRGLQNAILRDAGLIDQLRKAA